MNGGRSESIHSIVADDLICFCEKEKIVICPEWTHREENELSDHLAMTQMIGLKVIKYFNN